MAALKAADSQPNQQTTTTIKLTPCIPILLMSFIKELQRE